MKSILFTRKNKLALGIGALTCLTTQATLPPAYAGDYSFGGACPSQGAWTQMALSQAQSIAGIVQQLKNNPKCKGIESLFADLSQASSLMKSSENEVVQNNRLEALPAEMSALSSSMIENGNVDKNVSSMLLNRTIESAGIASNLANSSTLSRTAVTGLGAASGPVGAALIAKSLFKKYSAQTQKGIEIVSRVFKALPQYDECLIGQPQQGIALIGGAVKLAAAFSASGEGVGDRLGDAIGSLTSMLRDRKFTLALRKLDETEFWFSMSCLLESTTKNYCDAQNAQEILKYSQDQYQEAMKRNLKDRNTADYDNPLEGYYLLVRELPIISGWLQQVQFGVTPKLTTDAIFKNKVIDQVNDHTKTVNTLTGYFNEQMLFLKELSDTNAKRNHLFTMINYLVNGMTTGASAPFFATTVNETLMPFYLIGMDRVPNECSASAGLAKLEWDTWMKSGGADNSFVAYFNDPDKLAITVQARMGEIISGAASKSSSYFRQRLIVDMPNLVNQTLSGQYITVRKSFENVLSFLNRFETRLNKDSYDLILIPSVRETKYRIARFLKSYDKLYSLGKELALNQNASQDFAKRVDQAAQDVIDSAFTEFNILFQKDTFLTSRLTTYIEKDFSARVRSGSNMSAYQKDILTITQKHLLDKLIEVHGINPTSSQNDLARAQVINKRNIESLEEIFKDSLYKMIVDLKGVADGKGSGFASNFLLQKFKKQRSMLRALAIFTNPFTPTTGLMEWIFAGSAIKNQHPDLYKEPNNSNRVSGVDDKFGSFKQFQAMLCAQTLAFEDRAFFFDVCDKTILKSYYSGNKATPLDLAYNAYMPNANQGAKIKINPNLSSNAICALQKYQTKNLVKWLEDQDADLYQENDLY